MKIRNVTKRYNDIIVRECIANSGKNALLAKIFPKIINSLNFLVLEVLESISVSIISASLSGQGVWGSITGPIKSETVSQMAGHPGEVSSELCCPNTEPRR